jgi:hypothetical protein
MFPVGDNSLSLLLDVNFRRVLQQLAGSRNKPALNSGQGQTLHHLKGRGNCSELPQATIPPTSRRSSA